MGTQNVIFGGSQASGLDELSGASPISMNVILDQAGAIRRRPGISAFSDLYTGVIDPLGLVGLYSTYGGALYAVANGPAYRPVYKVNLANASRLSSTVGTGLAGFGRPVFAETQAILAIAGGDAIQKVLLASPGVDCNRLGGDPPLASHVISNSQRLLSNDSLDLSRIKFSETSSGSAYSGHENWTTGDSGYFNAEARADNVVAVHELAGEVYLFGSSTIQVWGTNPSSAYAPTITNEQGLSAAYGVVRTDNSFAYPDDRRRFVMTNGRSQENIGKAIQSTLDGVSNWANMFGYRVFAGQTDCLAWTVPGDRTFVHQIGGGWSEWSGWDGQNWTPFTVNCHAYMPLTQTNAVGTLDGKVGYLDPSAQTDLGTPIHAYAETGFMSGGTLKRKRNKNVTLMFRRTTGFTTDQALGLLSWRDNLGEWNPPIQIDLSLSQEPNPVIVLRSLGVYRTRQWRFSFAGAAPYLLARAIEEVDVLEN